MSVLYSLRPDLEFSTQTQHGKKYVVVKDPVTGRYLRFTENQGTILELLGDPIDLESLAAAGAARFGMPVQPASLEGLLHTLEEKLLLDTPGSRERLSEYSSRHQANGKQTMLYYRLASLDPERVFDWLYPRFQWCFTPTFHALATAVILAGFILSVLNADTLAGQATSLLNLYGVAAIWVVVMCVVTLHELAHGLTCRHFGGRVRELGFMLLYFMPAFYCDVSDSWMFPKRRHRMWVTFAGGYFQLVVWGLAVIVWRIAAPDSFVGLVALMVVLFAGLQTLFNFNPLIKLDGYYMLSDYLEIPNLRAKAFQTVRAWMAGQSNTLLESPHRKPLLTYGVLSLTFSSLLLSLVYVNIYILMTSYFAFAGLVGFVMFSGLTIKRAATEPAAGVQALVRRAAAWRHRNLGIAAAALFVLLLIPWQLRIAAEFTLLPHQEVVVRSETAGTVAEIRVWEGSNVMAGDVMALLYDFDKERTLSLVSGDLEQKQAELSLLVAGPRSEEVAQAQRLVETKEVELGNVRRNLQQHNQLEQTLAREQTELRLAQIEFDRTRELFEAGLGPRVDMEKAETQLEIQRAAVAETEASLAILAEANDREEDLKRRELAQAQSALNLLRAGYRSEEIEQRQAELEALKAEQKILHAELQKRIIVAPISGTIVTPFVERLKNRHLEAGDELFRIADTSTVSAELQVPEKEMSDVHSGSRVVLKVRSYPSRDFEGRVDFIAPVAETLGGEPFVKVRSDIPNEDGALKAEMTGVAKIYGGRQLVAQLMTRRLIRWVRTEFWDLLP